MPSIPPAGHSAAANDWFQSPPGRAMAASEAPAIDRALAERAGHHWLWLGPLQGGSPADGRGLRLARAGDGWHGDITCALPLPLPSEAFATVVLQHVVPAAGAGSDALLAEAARVLLPGGRLWLFVLNPLSPYRWRWRGQGLSALEPITWRRRLRRHGLAPDPVSQGIGPTWQITDAPEFQHGAGLRAAYLVRAEKRQFPLTPARPRAALRLSQEMPAV